MRMRLKVEGVQAAMLQLDKYGDAFCDHLGPIVLEAADIIRDDARRRAKGSIARAIESRVTWDHKKSKAFAAVYIPKGYNDQFQYYAKATNSQYYIPTAVEYGHRPPYSDKGTVYQIAFYKRGAKKGSARPVKFAKKLNKRIKPHPFIRPAYKSRTNRAEVKKTIEDFISILTLNWGDD